MGLAGLINMSMLVIAASLFHGSGHADVDSIEGAHAGLRAQLVGGGAALAFALALLASGLSRLERRHLRRPGRHAGLHRAARVPLLAAPRGDDGARAGRAGARARPDHDSLVISQVVLSFGIPFALVPLVLLTRRRDIMGALVNRRVTTVVASLVADGRSSR